MKILKGLVKIFSILFGLFVIIITIAVMGERYKIINQNKGDNYVRVEVKKLFGIRISEVEINSEGFYHGEGKSWGIFDGNLRQEGQWSGGFWHGRWKTFDNNGNIEMVREYKKGKLIKIMVPERGILQEIPKGKWPKWSNKVQQDKPVKAKLQ